MRCVDKGVNLTPYAKYRDAMPYLVQRIGPFCSYCEMEISNEPDVEHVRPKTLGGAALLLENFLLGCKKCNKIKSKKNPNRANHLWPDEDNTFVAYEYVNEIVVRPSAAVVGTPIETLARNTLNLTGIDRLPKNVAKPSKKVALDRRWQKRREAWGRAEIALRRWRINPSIELCEQIADTAISLGFFSIWVKFFSGPGEIQVLSEIRSRFQNTYDPVPNPAGGFVLRYPTARF
jgi:hypothetical protein